MTYLPASKERGLPGCYNPHQFKRKCLGMVLISVLQKISGVIKILRKIKKINFSNNLSSFKIRRQKITLNFTKFQTTLKKDNTKRNDVRICLVQLTFMGLLLLIYRVFETIFMAITQKLCTLDSKLIKQNKAFCV